MKTRLRLFFILVVFGIVTGCIQSTGQDEIAKYLSDLAAEDSFSGAVLVAQDGEIIFKEAYGWANRAFEVPNQVDTKFNLGSMNKMFTAVAILQLVQQGKLTVDDYIIQHLPNYPNQDIAERVTIHHLLTHTSGLGDFFTEDFFAISRDRIRTLNDYLNLFVNQPLRFEPGASMFYSNGGYIILGLIIEEVTGQSYFDYVIENIFEPCGMPNTDSYETDEIIPNLALGYSMNLSDDGTIRSNVLDAPGKGSSAGGGYSTAKDLLNFSQCLLNHQLLSPELTESLIEGKVEMLELGSDIKYGYGFIDKRILGHRIVGHSGGARWICANLEIFLDLGYTVVVLSNRDVNCHQVRTYIRVSLLE